MVLPTLRSRTFVDPCGLWHDEHAILPSRTGMCATARSVLATCGRWHVTQSSVSVFFTSWCSREAGLWTLWQVVHERFRAACLLASQATCDPRLWQARHVSLTSA